MTPLAKRAVRGVGISATSSQEAPRKHRGVSAPAPTPVSTPISTPISASITHASSDVLVSFVSDVRAEGKKLYRDLPWRNTRDPYAIWISEVMLQQTQVARVLGRWERFLARFPTVDALASAATSELLEEWQGLGYNRRALNLKRAADICSRRYAGRMPEGSEALRELPGIGEATAAGITVFSRDIPCTYLETNVRAVFIHRFFPDDERVTDKQLRPLVEAACPDFDVRGWYYALLDVGAHLKRIADNPSRRAAAYTRQGAFQGSRRQKRSWLLGEVIANPGVTNDELLARLNRAERKAGRSGVDRDTFESIMADLSREGFFAFDGLGWRI